MNYATDSLMSGLATAFIGSVTSICATAWIARRIEALWVSRNPGAPWLGGRTTGPLPGAYVRRGRV